MDSFFSLFSEEKIPKVLGNDVKKNEFDSSKTDSKDEIFFIFDPKREVEVGRSGKEQKWRSKK